MEKKNNTTEKIISEECIICMSKKKIDFTCYTCKTCMICKKCMYRNKIYKRLECPCCRSKDWLRCAFFEFDCKENNLDISGQENYFYFHENTDEEESTDDEEILRERENQEYEVNKIMSRYLENRISEQFSIRVLDDSAHYERLEEYNNDVLETTPLRRNSRQISRRRGCECNLYTSIFYIIVGTITIYLISQSEII